MEEVWGALMQAVLPAYLVAAATPWLGVWLCLLMQPAKMPYDAAYLIEAKHRVKVGPTLGDVRVTENDKYLLFNAQFLAMHVVSG